MRCVFDGSFEGLMTLVFDSYRFSCELEAVEEAETDSLLPGRFFASDYSKARRVRAYLEDRLGEEFAFMVKAAFLSARRERFLAIVRTIHRACRLGSGVLDLLDEETLLFLSCQREVRREAHRFQGLLRFSEMEDGRLLAVFAPRHHVLPLIMPHFAARLPGEELIVYDEPRRVAGLYERGTLSFARVEAVNARESGREREIQQLWRVFFERIAIRERLNPALQRQNMPRYTWKNLPEMREMVPLESLSGKGYDVFEHKRRGSR